MARPEKKQGRNSYTTCCIVDAQSVKNTDTAEEKEYDAGKKISGIKRHIFVDTNGLPHAIGTITANVSDRDGVVRVMTEHAEDLAEVQKLLVDGGYRGEAFAATVREHIGASVEVLDGMNCMRLRSFQSAGWWNVPLVGSRSVEDLGRTVNANYKQACTWSCWHSSDCC